MPFLSKSPYPRLEYPLAPIGWEGDAELHGPPGFVENTFIHSLKDCRNPPCPVHAPSVHHMVNWPLAWRETGIPMLSLVRVCWHGLFHPDPDAYVSDFPHECDYCCEEPSYEPAPTDFVLRRFQ